MGEKLREVENALKKIRIDFPGMLAECYAPGPIIQNISTSDKSHDEFEKVYRMVSAGIEPLIEENTEQLKDSAICYHRVHERVIEAADSMTEAESYLGSLIAMIKTDNIAHYIEEMKEEREVQEKEIEDSEIKQALAIDTLSIKDIHSGRLGDIMDNIQYVSEKRTRSEIKYQTENGLWRIKKEIENRIKDALMERGNITRMDLKVLNKIGGCANTGINEGVESTIVQIINRISDDLRKSIDQADAFTKEEEAHSLSRALGKFTREIGDLLIKVREMIKVQTEEEDIPTSKYRYNPELYENMQLNREMPSKTTSITLPIYETAVTDEEIFEKIVEWTRRLFKRLIGQSEHVSGDRDAKYSIEKINRTESAQLLYKEMYSNKYGDIGESENNSEIPESVMNVYAIRSEEAILIIHGCTLEISAVIRGVLADVLPDRLDIAERVKDLEIARCFKNRRNQLLALVERATVSSSLEDRSSFLQKYCVRVREVLFSLEKLVSVPINGLEKEIERTAEEIVERIISSIEKVFRQIARAKKGDLLDIRYTDLTSIPQEIEKWNNPSEECVLGPSIFTSFTGKKFLAASEFIQLPSEVSLLLKKAISVLEEESGKIEEKDKKEIPEEEILSDKEIIKDKDGKKDGKTEGEQPGKAATTENTEIKDKDRTGTTDNTIEHSSKGSYGRLVEMEAQVDDLSEKIFGYFTAHFLSLTKLSLEQALVKGDFLDRKLHHFLGTDAYLVRKARPIILEYITTHLIVNIDRCISYNDYPIFKQAISALQYTLVGSKLSTEDSLVRYLPMNTFYIAPYFQAKDKVFCSGVAGLYRENNMIFQKMSEIFDKNELI